MTALELVRELTDYITRKSCIDETVFTLLKEIEAELTLKAKTTTSAQKASQP